MRRVFLLQASDAEEAVDRAIEEVTRGDRLVRAPKGWASVVDRGGGWFLVTLSVWRARR